MGSNFDNFIGGLAFGLLGVNPFTRGFGCCCSGFGFGGVGNTVDFGTFANPFPTIFPPTANNGSSVMPMLTDFANPGFPMLDFKGPCQTIWDTFTNPDSDYNKKMREYYKQINEQQNTSNYSSNNQFQLTQFPFSPFFLPTSLPMNPFMGGYFGDTFVASKTNKDDTAVVEVKAKQDNSSIETYISKYSNDKYFNKMLSFIFEHEAGYVNHKNDRGGATNMGITQKTYDAYRKGKGLSKNDVKSITKDEAAEIYHNIYVECGADKIKNPKLAMCVLDWAVHSGAKNENLVRALKECNGDVNKFIKMRSDFLHRLIEKDPNQEDFRDGWDNRIRDLTAYVGNLPSNSA